MVTLKNTDALDINVSNVNSAPDLIGASRLVSAAADPFHAIDFDHHSIYDDGPVLSTLTFHQDFTQLLLSTAAIKGPTLTMVRNTQAMHSPAQSPGQVQFAPHNLLENANLGDRTGPIPSGWTHQTSTGDVSFEDHADGYSILTTTLASTATRFDNQVVTVTAGAVHTLYFYFHSSTITSAIVCCNFDATSGTDGDVTFSDIDTLGGNAGWYAVAFQMGAADADGRVRIGNPTNSTGTWSVSRPAVISGNSLGVALNTPVYCGSTPPLGAWVGTDDGDEPLYGPRLASGVYDGSPENEALWSEDFTPSTWTTTRVSVTQNAVANPINGDTTADKLVENTDDNTHVALNAHDISVVSGTTYTLSCYAKAAERDEIKLQLVSTYFPDNITAFINFGTGTVGTTAGTIAGSGIEAIGSDGWYRCWITGVADTTTSGSTTFVIRLSDGSEDDSYLGDGSSGIYIWGIHFEATSYPSTYMKSTNIPGKHMLETGVLIEEARTNSIVNSKDFAANGWTVTGSATVTSFDALGPDALISGAASYRSSADGTQLQTTIVDTNDNAAFSIYAKDVDGQFLRMQVLADGTDGAEGTWDLVSGVAVTAFAEGAGKVLDNGIDNIGNDWYRCWVAASGAAATDWDVNLFIATDADSSAEAVNESILIFGAQFEGNAAFITSYIETSGATVTRNVDALTTTDLSWYAATTATILVETLVPIDDGGFNRPIRLDADGNNLARITFDSGNARFAYNHNTGTGDDGVVLINAPDPVYGPLHKLAYAIADDDFQGAADGQTGTADTTATAPTSTALDTLYVGDNTPVSCYVKDLKGYNTRRTDAQLETDSLPLPLVAWDFTQATLAASSLTGESNVQSTGGTPVLISSRNDTDATFFNSSGVLTQVGTANEARVSSHLYNGTAWVNHGVLLEEARTNLATHSEGFGDTGGTGDWNFNAITVTDNTDVAPDGNTTADTITADSGDAVHSVAHDAITISSDTDYAITVFAKAGTHNFLWVCMRQQTGTEDHITGVFDLNSGVIGETDVGTTSGTIALHDIEDVSGGWYRCILVGKVTDTTVVLQIGLAEAASGNTFDTRGRISFDAAGTETLILWGSQMELGAFPTSYVPATGDSSVTRNADKLLTDETWWYNDTQGSWFLEGLVPADPNANGSLMGLTLSGNSDYFRFQNRSDDKVRYTVNNSADTDVLSDSVGTITYGTAFKHASAYADDDAAHSLDGETAVADSSVGIPLAARPTQLVFGAISFDAACDQGKHIKTLKYWPLRLADSVLESEST